MNYHETLPTTPGLYLIDGTEALMFRSDGKWYGHAAREVFDVERFTPMLGPLPRWEEDFLSLACEVAFARMSRAAFKVDYHRRCEFLDAQWKYLHEGPSLSLLREMERVTGELTKK